MGRKHRFDVTPRRQHLVRRSEYPNFDRETAMTTLEALGIDFDIRNIGDDHISFHASKDEIRAYHNTYPEIARQLIASQPI